MSYQFKGVTSRRATSILSQNTGSFLKHVTIYSGLTFIFFPYAILERITVIDTAANPLITVTNVDETVTYSELQVQNGYAIDILDLYSGNTALFLKVNGMTPTTVVTFSYYLQFYNYGGGI